MRILIRKPNVLKRFVVMWSFFCSVIVICITRATLGTRHNAELATLTK